MDRVRTGQRAGPAEALAPGAPLVHGGKDFDSRIEDVVQVTAAKPKMLSRYPYVWELR